MSTRLFGILTRVRVYHSFYIWDVKTSRASRNDKWTRGETNRPTRFAHINNVSSLRRMKLNIRMQDLINKYIESQVGDCGKYIRSLSREQFVVRRLNVGRSFYWMRSETTFKWQIKCARTMGGKAIPHASFIGVPYGGCMFIVEAIFPPPRNKYKPWWKTQQRSAYFAIDWHNVSHGHLLVQIGANWRVVYSYNECVSFLIRFMVSFVLQRVKLQRV